MGILEVRFVLGHAYKEILIICEDCVNGVTRIDFVFTVSHNSDKIFG